MKKLGRKDRGLHHFVGVAMHSDMISRMDEVCSRKLSRSMLIRIAVDEYLSRCGVVDNKKATNKGE